MYFLNFSLAQYLASYFLDTGKFSIVFHARTVKKFWRKKTEKLSLDLELRCYTFNTVFGYFHEYLLEFLYTCTYLGEDYLDLKSPPFLQITDAVCVVTIDVNNSTINLVPYKYVCRLCYYFS